MASDPWSHTHKEWQKTFNLARERGWPPPKEGSNHKVKHLRCPEDAIECRSKAFSTGKATEGPARTAYKKVRNCPHSVPTTLIAEITDSLDRADRLLTAAETQLEWKAAAAIAAEILEQAVAVLQSADEVLALVDNDSRAAMEVEYAEAEAEEVRTRSVHEDAAAQVAQGGSLREWVDDAGAELGSAEGSIADIPTKHEENGTLRARLSELNFKYSDLLRRCSE